MKGLRAFTTTAVAWLPSQSSILRAGRLALRLAPLIFLLLHLRMALPFFRFPLSCDEIRYADSRELMPQPQRFLNLVIFRTAHKTIGLQAWPLRILGLAVHWLATFAMWRFLTKVTGKRAAAFLACVGMANWGHSTETYGIIAQIGQPLWAWLILEALNAMWPSPNRRAWHWIVGLGCAGLSAVAWEHGPLGIAALAIMHILVGRGWRSYGLGIILVLALILTVAVQVFEGYLPQYLAENMTNLTWGNIGLLMVSILQKLRVQPFGELAFQPPVLLVIAVAGGIGLGFRSTRAKITSRGALTLILIAGCLFCAGFMPLMFRLSTADPSWTILGLRHVFFMAPTLTLCAAATIALHWRALTDLVPARRELGPVLLLAVILLSPASGPRREGFRTSESATVPFQSIADAIGEQINWLKQQATVVIRPGPDFYQTFNPAILVADRIRPFLAVRYNRSDIKVVVAPVGQPILYADNPDLVLTNQGLYFYVTETEPE